LRQAETSNWSVIFSTYHSTPFVSEAALEEGVEFDLIVSDEAHRTATGGKFGEGCFKLILDNELMPARRRLFLTATPKVYNRRIKAKAAAEGYDVASMDDEDRYGTTIYKYSFAEAIKKKVLADYRVILMTVTSKEIEDLIQERKFVHSDEEAVDAATLATHIALAKSIQRFGLKKIIVYHPTIKDASVFSDPSHPYSFIHSIDAAKMLANRVVWTDSVSSRMRANKRLRVLDMLRQTEDTAIVSNAKCLTEGIDVPSLDAVMFTHPKHSVVDIVQAIGRAIRLPSGWKPKNKDDYPPPGHIIIPVVMTDDNPDASIDATSYDTIASVIRQLRTIDEGLGEVIDQYRIGRGERLPTDPASTAFDKLQLIDIPDGLDAEYLKKAIRSKVVELTSDYWMAHYYALEDFAKEKGHARPSKGRFGVDKSGKREAVTHKGFRIGDWVGRQRRKYKKGLMPQSQVELLESLPQWSWDPQQDKWESQAEGLRRFMAGDIERPPNLWKWVSRTRQNYREGKLTDDRIADLEAIEGWSWEVSGYGARGKKKVDRPSEKQLIADAMELLTATRVGEKYGVSDNAVRKWLKSDGWTKAQISELFKRAKEKAREASGKRIRKPSKSKEQERLDKLDAEAERRAERRRKQNERNKKKKGKKK
jgi:superfamily II DNA or RNA helicase